MKKSFEPNFKTPDSDLCKEELNKRNKTKVNEQFFDELRNDKADIIWEVEQIAKSSGIYLEFDRSVKGAEKDWRYMIRIAAPGGGPISREQWNVFDDLSRKYTANPQGHTSLRVTTRQTIQFHWLKKKAVIDVVRSMAEAGLYSLNGCGDNTRNVMACPLSRFSDIFNANQWAHTIGEYFQLPVEPFIKIFAIDPKYLRQPKESFQYGDKLLNRKFKIALSSVIKNQTTGQLIPNNCVELRSNDVGIAPILDNGQVNAFQIYIGGGQGERNGKPSMAALGLPFAIVPKEELLKTLDAIVHVHQEWGDRQNRYWARIKYVIKKQGIDWLRDQVSQRLGQPLLKPDPNHDYGDRHLHFGWTHQDSNKLWSYGLFIENGRITDNSPNGQLQTMIRNIINKYPVEIMLTPNQHVIFTNIPEDSKTAFEDNLKSYGYGQRNGQPYSTLRQLSGACVGRDTCRLTYTDSEKFEPLLIDELEQLGWGEMAESIGITGCERQCYRPATKTIGLVGSGLNRYQFKLFGDQGGHHQGQPLITSNGEEMYLRSVKRDKITVVIDALFKFYQANKKDNENLGEYHRRIGADTIIAHLKDNPATTELMSKPFNTDCVIG